ncbi:MAG: helix-turn-helix transcriptional regulator, partial [Oscillospiraceae bacterium]|nr:helix-turn-helix transcriptional regulator [Oscillospiraceae bacterium]
FSGKKGDLFLFYPNQLHEFRTAGGEAVFLCLQISPQVFASAYPELRTVAVKSCVVSEFCCESQKTALRMEMRSLLQEYLDRKPYYELRCISRAAEIMASLLSVAPAYRLSEEELSSADKRNARLSRFLNYADENYMHKISLAEFAEAEGCTVSYMSRFLKQNLNQTFQEYINMIRYHSACRLIRSGRMRLLDVCEEVGFSDYRYFSSCFRKECGMTPEEYRRRTELPDQGPGPRSLYSVERFFTREESYTRLRSL